MRTRVWMSVCLFGVMVGATLPIWAHKQTAPAPKPSSEAAAPSQPPESSQEQPAHGDQPPVRSRNGRNRTPFPAQQRPPAPPEVVARGKALYASLCSACHGADARGGQLGGVNLLRSQLVLNDRNGELVLPVVKNGRPGTAMAPIPMPDDDVRAVTAFIHSLQAEGGRQGSPPPGPPVELDILVGDAKAGAAYFDSHCAACHSTAGDLAGIASRVDDPKTLQNLWVSGGRAAGRGRGRRDEPDPGQIPTVTVTMPGGAVVEGRLVQVDDFLVTVGLPDGTTRTIRRDGDSPSVQITDPLARHDELLAIYTNKDMHDVTAYLATLK